MDLSGKKIWNFVWPILLGCVVILSLISFLKKRAPRYPINNGTLELKQELVAKSGHLAGKWRIKLGSLIVDEETFEDSIKNFESLDLITTPGRWSEVTGIGRMQGSNTGVASYILELTNPEGFLFSGLGLSLPPLAFAYELFFYDSDKQKVFHLGEMGLVSKQEEEVGSARRYHLTALPSFKQGYLIIQAANFAHADVRFNFAPILGPVNQLVVERDKFYLSRMFFVGISFTIFIIFFFQFFFRRQDNASLGLGCLAFAFMMSNLGLNGTLFSVLEVPFAARERIGIALEYMALPLGGSGVLAYSYFSQRYFSMFRRTTRCLLVSGLLLFILSFILPSVWATKTAYFSQAHIFACMIIATIVDLRRSVVSVSARVGLIGYTVLFSSVGLDILAINGFLDLPELSNTSTVLFTIFLAQAYSLENAKTFNHERELSRTLKDEVDRKTENLQKKTIEIRNLLRVVTHDINNPLSVIIGSLEIALRKFGDAKSDVALKFTKKAANAANQVSQILEHVREMDAISAGKKGLKLEPVCIKKCLEDIGENFSERLKEKDITLQYPDTIDDKLTVIAEPTSLRHNVLANIVSNSIKFSDAGSTISIEIAVDKDEVELRVKDQGVGMPTSIKENLFSPFAKTTRDGTMGRKVLDLACLSSPPIWRPTVAAFPSAPEQEKKSLKTREPPFP